MKKKSDKDILFERMGKVDSSFKRKIDENSEPKPFNSIDPNLKRGTPEYDAAVAKHYEEQGYMPDGVTPLPEPNSAQKVSKERGLKEEDSSPQYEIVPCNYGIVDESQPPGKKLVAIGGEGNVIYKRDGIDFDEAMRVAQEAKKNGY